MDELWRCNMSKKDLIKELISICEPIAASLNYELVDVEFIKEFGSYYLRVYIHKEGGISLDDCQAMSELLSEKLDVKDPIKMQYYLEVSSPGLDRPLKNDKDLKRNIGREIEINLYAALDNKRQYEGILESFDGDFINIVDEKNNTLNIPRDSVSQIRLALKF